MQFDNQRIQITTSIKSLDEHLDKQLKSFIQNFLWKARIGCSIERIPHSADPHDASTAILFEGKFGDVQAAKVALINSLEHQFPHLTIPQADEWVVGASTEKLSAAKIVQTRPSIRRGDSSGEVSKSLPLDRMEALSNSASSWIQNLYRKALEALPIAQALQISGKLPTKIIHVHFKRNVEKMEISLLLWDDFLQRCRDYFEISGQIRKICEQRTDGSYERVRLMEGFENDHDYYIEVEGDPELNSPPLSPQSSVPVSPQVSFTTMEQFYEALRGVGLNDAQINKISDVFEEQDIVASVLPTLTDADLEKYGLKQGGLRKAILAVLGKQ